VDVVHRRDYRDDVARLFAVDPVDPVDVIVALSAYRAL